MSAKRIAYIARGLTQPRIGAIHALIAGAALALALFSCSEPPMQPQPTPLPTIDAAVAATPVPATPTPHPTTEPTPTLTPIDLPGFVPLPDDTQFTQITAGKYHACGLQADGTTLCWGNNISGSLNAPVGMTFSQISAGLNFACGLRDDAIYCWGQNDAGQASPPKGRFDEIATGRDHACALDDGALICWGGGFPDGAEIVQEMPPLSAIQAGLGFTCGLTPDADMACWKIYSEELAINPGPFTDIGIGLHHACAIRVDGSVFCDEEGEYDRHGRSRPPPTKFVQISGGWFHVCGITQTSDIECWGSGERGVVGERLSAPEGKFTTLAIGWRNSCALSPDGHAVCWRQPYVQKPSELEPHEAFGGTEFKQPVDLFPLPDGRIAILERKGIITAYSDEPNAASPETILDLTEKTICCKNDNGMLSAVLDPQFEEFPFLYVYYKALSEHAYGENVPGVTIRLARFRVKGGKAAKDSELTIFDVAQPGGWHHGGAIRFGADGMLYVGTGYNYPTSNSQSLQSLLGKILRIDVRGAMPNKPYRIPPDNPFVNNPEALPEIWAYGLRNPWRMDFAPDGRLFVADVGVDKYEEVSLAAAGANLGWPMCEGSVCEEGVEADANGLTAPIFTYDREDGCAVVGGVTSPRMNNGFVFGDYCSGQVWLLEEDERESWRARALLKAERYILSFGIVDDGTVYILMADKPILRMLPVGAQE